MNLVLTQLKKAMEEKGITVEELATKTLMSARTIEKARSGRGMPLNTCKRIANALRTKVLELE